MVLSKGILSKGIKLMQKTVGYSLSEFIFVAQSGSPGSFRQFTDNEVTYNDTARDCTNAKTYTKPD